MTFKTYALISTALAGLMSTSSVLAQTAAAPAASAPTEVVVTGFRKSLATALNAKKHEERISDGISSEDLGKFPSENIAEAIQRCLLYTSPSPRDGLLSRMPSSA